MTPLHWIGDWLREMLIMIPLPMVRILFVALPAVVLVWVIRQPRAATAEPSGSSWAQNLKLWAALALLIQILIYAFV